MTVDGYYLPDEIAHAAQVNADRLQTHQHVGIVYQTPIRDCSEGIFSPVQFFRDAAIGRYCTWVYGPDVDELRDMDKLAVILWIAPRRAHEICMQ